MVGPGEAWVYSFPDPRRAAASGLVAYGGDLCPERLLSAYARGIFPWYESGPIRWYSPDPRAVLLPGRLHVGRNLRRMLAKAPYEIRLDTAFERVVRRCAEIPRPGQDGTWITPDMIAAYTELFELGYAHSAEAWEDGELVGGLYGVSLGAAFFGESMFASRDDASKMAFAVLVRQLGAWGFHFVDCQVETPLLTRFGAESWPRERFLAALEGALQEPSRRGRWRLDAAASRPICDGD